MQTEANEPIHIDPKKRKGFFFWTGRVLLWMILIWFGILGLVHFPPIQRWGVKKITASISKTLDTRVVIGSFTLHPISDLTLFNVLIGSPEHPEDTLLSAAKLYVDYQRIWDVFQQKLTITQLGIENGLLNIHKITGDSLTNLDLALYKMLPEANPDKGAFVLNLKTLHARSLNIRLDDEPNGTLVNTFLTRLDAELNVLDISGKYIAIRDLDVDEPIIRIINRPPTRDTIYQVAPAEGIWSIDIDRWRLRGGILVTDDQRITPLVMSDHPGIDFAHMALEDIQINVDSLVMRGMDMSGKNIDIRLRHQNGFEIRTLSADRANLTSNGIFIDQLRLRTADSDIQNSISLGFSGYSDFKTFVDSVKIEIPTANIRLRVSDLITIMPALQKVQFFKDNARHDISVQGHVTGHINRLRILGMHAAFGPLSLTGDFRSRDLTVKGAELISLDLQGSAFSAGAVKSIFPGIHIPPMMDKLGQINFTGKMDGYLDDFVAYGTFRTALGNVTLDMNLNTVRGIAQGKYSGQIAMQEFDLGKLTGSPDLGKVTMSGRVIEGTGLSTESMFADITAQLTSLQFKGYTYRNARVDGQLTGKLFSGTLDINDPNIEMHFEGTVDLRGKLPELDFISRIEHIDFRELKLVKDSMILSGIFDVDMTVGKLDEISGFLLGENVNLRVREIDYTLDTLQLTAGVDTMTGDRLYLIRSDILSGTISGIFDPTVLPLQFQHYLHHHYPGAFEMPEKALTIEPQQRLAWNLTIHDSEHWFDLVGQNTLQLKNAKLSGTTNLQEEKTSGVLELPEVHYGNISAYGTTIAFAETSGRTDIDLELIAADLNENFFFEDVYVTGSATKDSVNFNFKTDHLADIVNELDLDVTAKPRSGTWDITFNPLRLIMLGGDWKVPAGNVLEIRKDEFVLQNFELVSGDRKILLHDINRKGLDAYISGFEISYLNELWINDKFQFAGLYTLDLEIDNLYDIRQMNMLLTVPDMKINNVDYGAWILQAAMSDPKDSVRIQLSMEHNQTFMTATGAYLPPIKSIPKAEQNYLRMDIVATEFPLDFLEFLMGGNIRDTEGSIDMNLTLTGKTNALNPKGEGKVYNGSTVIDYLGAAYSFHDQSFRITESLIDLSGTKLYDVLGNTATVDGGITHQHFRNLGLNATIISDRILGLDVTSEENNVFYGRGIGSVYARFTGTLANAYMQIHTTTAKGTHIYIPLSGAAENTDRDFVIFLENGMLPATTATQINLGGINLTMNMTITEDAVIEIIFDEAAGEVLRATGNGNLQMAMSRTGNFEMYGTYIIEQGDYLFTNFQIIRKPFQLLRGGQITWEGDPYNATLNVQAKYKGLTAPVYTLIQEYLPEQQGQGTLIDQARERTEIDLTMTLTGSLLQPNIEFDIAFPSLTGEIKGYTDSKVNALKANENAMNEQVVGLLITRSFLPANAGSGNPFSTGIIITNTLSELIAVTLSNYLSGLLGNLIPQGNFLTGVGFSVGFDLPFTGNSGLVDESGQLEDPNATEVEVNLPLEFFNDRLSVNIGGNYVTNAVWVLDKDYIASDVTFEYQITRDRRLKIRAYNRNTMTIQGPKNKIGLGIGYRREYDSFSEIFRKKPKEEK